MSKMKKNIILMLLLTLFVSGEVFSQSRKSRSSKKKGKVRTSQSKTRTTTPTETKTSRTTTPANSRTTPSTNSQKRFNPFELSNKARIDTKDGAMFLGTFVNESKNEVSIEILTGDIITINKDQISKAYTPINSIVVNKGRFHRVNGLYLHYNLGFNAGISAGGLMGDIGLGYRLTPQIELLAGIGFMGTSISTPFTRWSEQKTFFPVYLGGQYNITHGKLRLFASAKAGYSNVRNRERNIWWGFNEAIDMTGGAYIEPGIGVTFPGKRVARTQFSLTQIFQYSNFTFESRDDFNNLISGSGNIWVRRIGFRITTTIF